MFGIETNMKENSPNHEQERYQQLIDLANFFLHSNLGEAGGIEAQEDQLEGNLDQALDALHLPEAEAVKNAVRKARGR